MIFPCWVYKLSKGLYNPKVNDIPLSTFQNVSESNLELTTVIPLYCHPPIVGDDSICKLNLPDVSENHSGVTKWYPLESSSKSV